MLQTPQLCKQELSKTIKKHYSDGGLQYSGSKLISQLSAALNQMIKAFPVEQMIQKLKVARFVQGEDREHHPIYKLY